MMAMEMGSGTKGWRSPSGRGSSSFFILRLLDCVPFDGSGPMVRSFNESMDACIVVMINGDHC